MLSHELHIIWICSDGKKFINKEKAINHENKIQKESEDIQKLLDSWEDYY